MHDPAMHDGGLLIPEAEALRERLRGRSRLAQAVLLVGSILVASLLSYHLLLLVGIVPEWLGSDVPPRTQLLLWVDIDGTKLAINSGRYHLPWIELAWLGCAVWLPSAVIVWRWALHVSKMNVRLHVPAPDRHQPRRLYAPELLWFSFSISGIAAAYHYARLLWCHSAPGPALGQWSLLPSTLCGVFVLEWLFSSVFVMVGWQLTIITLGLVFKLVLLGLSIAMIRRIDARVAQRLAWVRSRPRSPIAS